MAVAPVVSAHTGTNADLIAEVCRLYAPPGSVIADVTYGRGRFWRKTDLAQCTLLASDITAGPGVAAVCDFRRLPYRDGSLDVVVLDPPYVHNAGTANPHDYRPTTTRYNGHTTAGLYNADIMGLYAGGLAEAFRVLRAEGGTCWVKCKDEVEREVQRWSHIAVYHLAIQAGFCARDLFVLTGTTSPQRWPGRVQHHARKTHSYLWIFQRPDKRYARLLGRPAPAAKGAPPLATARYCACGCGRPVPSPRSEARFATGACRVRAHRAR